MEGKEKIRRFRRRISSIEEPIGPRMIVSSSRIIAQIRKREKPDILCLHGLVKSIHFRTVMHKNTSLIH